MRLNFIGGIVAVLVVAALIVAYSSLFTVYQTAAGAGGPASASRCASSTSRA